MRRRSAIAGIASCFVALTIAAPASAGTLDQQQTSSNLDPLLTSTQSGAQTFTAGISGGLDQADLDLVKYGAPPASVTVEIRNTDNAGKPRTVLATGTIPTSAIGTAHSFVPATFTTPAPVTAGTLYALVAYSQGSGLPNSVGWRAQTAGDPYSGGELFLSDGSPGANWSGSAAADFAFKTYVMPTPPSPTPPSVSSTKLTGTCKGQQATIVGTEGNDVRSGTPGPDVVVALGGNDTLSGLRGNDVICGGPGKDTLRGGADQDTLLGQKGKDKLKGGGGADLCKGGKGTDMASKCEVEKSI